LAAEVRVRLLGALAVVMVSAAGCGGGSAAKSPGASAATATSTVTSTSTTVDLASRVQTFSGLAQTHTQDPVTYPQTPPVGGPHFPVWMNCGYYPQAVQNELAVHSMEHGAVWITYRPSLAKADVDVLRAFARTPYVLVSPWRDDTLPSPVVASAWGLQLKADTARDPAVKAFVDKYANGPQTPEKGAPCTGGFGTPQS
jgi:hypothetical protein